MQIHFRVVTSWGLLFFTFDLFLNDLFARKCRLLEPELRNVVVPNRNAHFSDRYQYKPILYFLYQRQHYFLCLLLPIRRYAFCFDTASTDHFHVFIYNKNSTRAPSSSRTFSLRYYQNGLNRFKEKNSKYDNNNTLQLFAIIFSPKISI